MTHQSAHDRVVSKTEFAVLNHLANNDDQRSVFHALNLLKEHDARHGRNFHKDLANINQQLHWDMATQDLPTVTIHERGRGYKIRPDASPMSQLSGLEDPLQSPFEQALERAMFANDSMQPARAGSFMKPPVAADTSYACGLPNLELTAFNPASDLIKPLGSLQGERCPSKNGFGHNLLQRLGLPVTSQNLSFLDAWQRAEGGSADNPFNTTQRMTGHDRTINHDGVKRYDSMHAGLEATAKTLQYDRYRGIISALRRGTNAHECARAVASSKWGTGELLTQLI
jgi:hypothetical protein